MQTDSRKIIKKRNQDVMGVVYEGVGKAMTISMFGSAIWSSCILALFFHPCSLVRGHRRTIYLYVCLEAFWGLH